MKNLELKQLVKLYWQAKTELDELQEAYLKSETETKLMDGLQNLLKEKFKASNPMDRQIMFDKFFYFEHDRVIYDGIEPIRKINDPQTKIRVLYLETKLDVIKGILGEENLKDLEKYERERILKNAMDDFKSTSQEQEEIKSINDRVAPR